ncbi:MAG: hypothetical protein MUE34_03350 [Acidimicrobiales bacterium]|nr:hypothetical protein [Acidimicrobiales bacterium]
MPPVETLLAASTAETVGVIGAVVASAFVGALVGTVVTRRRRPPTDAALADARIAALWAGTRDEPTPPDAVPPTSSTALAITVWRLPPDQVLGLVLDALGDHGLEPVEVAGDRAVLTAGPITAVATYNPAVAIDDTGQGLHVHIELSGQGAPALADALRRRLVTSSPPGGPVALVQDPTVSARPGAPRR